MPQIVARYLGITATGRNANERLLYDRAPPSTAIQAVSVALYNFMNGLNFAITSAFACAEAQAFAKLLPMLPNPADFTLVEFGRPTSEGGLELWNPCGNCSQWLTVKGGFGSRTVYQLSNEALKRLPQIPNVVPVLNLNDPNMFPPLGGK